MANIVLNIAKGRFVHYGTLPAANDAIIVVPLEASGLETDAVLIDYDNLAALLAGTTNEQTTMGRKTATGVTVTVDDTNNWAFVDMSDITWTAATGNAVGALLVCYDPGHDGWHGRGHHRHDEARLCDHAERRRHHGSGGGDGLRARLLSEGRVCG